MNNIERFSTYTAKVFATLYEGFPEPRFLDCRQIVHGEQIKGTGPEGSLHINDLQRVTLDKEIVFCAHTLRWLYQTNYFTGEMSQYDVRATNAVLTPKSFEALAAMPRILDGKGTLGQQISTFAQDTTKNVVQGGITELVGQIIGSAFRGFVGGS